MPGNKSCFEAFSLPEAGSGVYLAPEVLPKGAVKHLYLLQPAWWDANTATMAPKNLFSLGWTVWGK